MTQPQRLTPAEERERYVQQANQPVRPVEIVRLDVPFWNLAGFLFKVLLAFVPVAILVFIISMAIYGFITGFFGALTQP